MRSSTEKYEIPNFSFSKNELQSRSFNGNVFHTWTGPVNNEKNLTSLDLSSNFCSKVSTTIFSQDFNNLKQLLLQDNLLELVIPKDIEGDILQNLKSVDHIHLSKNQIVHLPKKFFKTQQKLERLDLIENLIEDINFQVLQMKNLIFLDFRNNKISKLGLYAMNKFDSVAKQSAHFTIDLGGNNLLCNCDSLSSVQWMVNTPTHLHGRNKYECKMSNNTKIVIRNPREIFV